MDNQNGDQSIGDIQMLTLILSENQSNKCVRLLKEKELNDGMVIIGRGTVSSSVLNILGIKNQRKDIVQILLKKDKAEEILDYFDDVLQLKKPGHGIAYTTPVIFASGLTGQETDNRQVAANTDKNPEGKSMFNKMTVIVDRGMSNDVMEIALKEGVRGGTILHGRGAGAEIATNLFGVKIEPEKELVIILMPNDLVDKVANALSEELHLDEPGKGILFVEPIIDTRGLLEMNEKSSK